MSLSRFKEREIIRNNDDDYKIVFQSRIPYNGLRQYSYEELKYPTDAELAVIQKTQKVWGYGSRLYKLSNEFYGDPSYWWVIAWFNKKPTENHFSLGDEVLIPYPLERIMKYFGD